MNDDIALAKLLRNLVAVLMIVAAVVGAFIYLSWKALTT